MNLHQRLFDGSLRPYWAGGVQGFSKRRELPGGKVLHSAEVTGIVLPLSVHRKYLSGNAGHRHTFGMGLGFPDLRHYFPLLMHDPEMSKGWGGLEDDIKEAALKSMHWGGAPRSRSLARAAPPGGALQMRVASRMIRDRESGEKLANAESDSLSGEVARVLPIRDVSGTRMRMEQVGSPANFYLTPFAARWSKDPDSV